MSRGSEMCLSDIRGANIGFLAMFSKDPRATQINSAKSRGFCFFTSRNGLAERLKCRNEGIAVWKTADISGGPPDIP